MDTQANAYQLTFNDPVKKGYTHQCIKDTLRNNFKTLLYFCMADEQGSMFHTHVYIVFNSRVRWSMVKKYFPEAHIEKSIGSVSTNVEYIKKSGRWILDESKQEQKIEGTFEEYGTQPPDSRGRRNDMSELYQMVLDNMTNAEILAVNQDYILQIDKLDKIRTTVLTERYKETVRLELECIYVSGSTGTGKTRGIFEENGYSNVYRVTDYLHPFDGYACQPILCFDEFRDSIKLKDMLLYCDIYPIELPSRFSNKFACYHKVYIVSNWELERQYSELQISDKESWQAFLRRIHKVIVYEAEGKRTEYQSVEEYFNRKCQFEDCADIQTPFD